jgi:hypothetical protein
MNKGSIEFRPELLELPGRELGRVRSGNRALILCSQGKSRNLCIIIANVNESGQITRIGSLFGFHRANLHDLVSMLEKGSRS